MRTPSLVLCELTKTNVPGLESYSPFCLKVHRALRAAGLRYESLHDPRPDAYRKHNPLGQVPVLLVDGEPVFDSTRILERIETLAVVPLSRSSDVAARAEAWLWEEMADTSLNGFVVAARWADERNWAAVRAAYFGAAPWLVRAMIVPRIRARVIGALCARDVWRAGAEACWRRFEATLDHLEMRAPVTEYWMGSASSVADLAIFAQLHSLRTALTEPQARSIAARARLSAYLDRVDLATRATATLALVPQAREVERPAIGALAHLA
jgi:glutathione S-transferase